MAKLTYWCAPHLSDAQCYSIRAKTKKECLRIKETSWNPTRYGAPRKVVVEYADAFDLLTQAMGEGGVYEGMTIDDYTASAFGFVTRILPNSLYL